VESSIGEGSGKPGHMLVVLQREHGGAALPISSSVSSVEHYRVGSLAS